MKLSEMLSHAAGTEAAAAATARHLLVTAPRSDADLRLPLARAAQKKRKKKEEEASRLVRSNASERHKGYEREEWGEGLESSSKS